MTTQYVDQTHALTELHRAKRAERFLTEIKDRYIRITPIEQRADAQERCEPIRLQMLRERENSTDANAHARAFPSAPNTVTDVYRDASNEGASDADSMTDTEVRAFIRDFQSA